MRRSSSRSTSPPFEQDLAVVVVRLRRAEAEDRRHRGHDHHVPPREQRRRGGVAQAVDLLVDRRVLLDVEVLARDVGLGLVVVVVGDEVLDRVLREVRAELVAELRRQRLVVGEDERGPLQALDRRRHRHRLAGAGGAQQRHAPGAGLDPLDQAVDGLRLVGGRRVDGVELERRHGPLNDRSRYGRTGAVEARTTSSGGAGTNVGGSSPAIMAIRVAAATSPKCV